MQKVNQTPPVLLFALTLIPTIGVLALFVAPIHEQEEYFLHSFVILGVFLVVLIMQEAASRASFSRTGVVATIGLSGTLALAISALTPTNEGTTFAIFVRVVLGSPVTLVTVCIGAALLLMKLGNRQTGRAGGIWLLAGTLTVAAISSNERWFTRAGTFKQEILSESHVLRYLGDEDVIEAAELVKRNTNLDDVIASNYFCEASWCPTSEYSPARDNWLVGGEAMTLVVYSQRRYLVSGYGFTWQNIAPPSEVRRRISWSLHPQPSDSPIVDNVVPKYFLRDLTMPCPCGELIDRPVLDRTKRFELYDLSMLVTQAN
jgi:hypothetical protein